MWPVMRRSLLRRELPKKVSWLSIESWDVVSLPNPSRQRSYVSAAAALRRSTLRLPCPACERAEEEGHPYQKSRRASARDWDGRRLPAAEHQRCFPQCQHFRPDATEISAAVRADSSA